MQRSINRSTQGCNTKTSIHRSSIRIEENRKLDVLKHLYQSSRVKCKIMPIHQTSDFTLLQIKEKNL